MERIYKIGLELGLTGKDLSTFVDKELSRENERDKLVKEENLLRLQLEAKSQLEREKSQLEQEALEVKIRLEREAREEAREAREEARLIREHEVRMAER